MSAVLTDLEPLLTTSQVAHILGCHPSACVRWIQKGSVLADGTRLKLAAVATPGGWRIRREALDAFLERLTADRGGDPEPAPKPRQSARMAQMYAGLTAADLVR
jgi:excisionase family DNA binding protein